MFDQEPWSDRSRTEWLLTDRDDEKFWRDRIPVNKDVQQI